MIEEKCTNNELRVSVMKPFFDIRVGARFKLECSEEVKDLYGSKDTATMKDGTKVSRNKLIMTTLAENEDCQKWVNILLKVVIPEGTDIKDEVPNFDNYFIPNNRKSVYINCNLNELLVWLKYFDSKSDVEVEKFGRFYNKVFEALDRVIEMQINVPNVFTSFYKDFYLKK
jgi:hypothetical protein